MPIDTRWLVEYQVIYSYGWGTINHEDAQQFAADIETLAKTARYQVHLIQHVRDIEHPYTDLLTSLQLFNFARHMQGWYIQIGDPTHNKILAYMASVIARILRIKTKPMMQSYEEARDFFRQLPHPIELPDHLPDQKSA